MNAVKIGKTIAFLRKNLNMTQKELSEKLCITDKAVSRWERGAGSPDISILTKLSAVLDTDIETILEGNLSQNDIDCKALLVMNYPQGIGADSFLYTKRIVCFQLSFFMLAGIKEICIRGKQSDIDFVKSALCDGKSLGIALFYETAETDSDFATESDYFLKNNDESSFLVIDGLHFLYGKGITSSLKRMIFDSDCRTVLTDHSKKSTSITYFPPKNRLASLPSSEQKTESLQLCRGMVSFTIQNEKDLFDAGNILRIVEEQHGERVADLNEIARNRGFVQAT